MIEAFSFMIYNSEWWEYDKKKSEIWIKQICNLHPITDVITPNLFSGSILTISWSLSSSSSSIATGNHGSRPDTGPKWARKKNTTLALYENCS